MYGQNYNQLNFNANQSRQQNTIQIDEQQFKTLAKGLTQQQLMGLVQQARANGIADNEIEKGLNLILQMK